MSPVNGETPKIELLHLSRERPTHICIFCVSPLRRYLIRYLPKMSKHNHLFAYTGFQCKITLSKCHKDNGHTFFFFFFKFQTFCKYFTVGTVFSDLPSVPHYTWSQIPLETTWAFLPSSAIPATLDPRIAWGRCYVLAFNVHPTVRHFISQNESFWRHWFLQEFNEKSWLYLLTTPEFGACTSAKDTMR